MSADRRFALVTALLLLAVGWGLGWYLDRAGNAQAIGLAEQQNIDLARTLASTLRRDVRQFLTDAQQMNAEDLRSAPRATAFRQAMQLHLTGLPIVKVKIYDQQGLTVFSTELAQIGEDKAANAGFRRALAGGIATELTYRNQFSAFDDIIVDRNLLSSYVPITDTAGRIDSVFEIYQDITHLLDSFVHARYLRNAVIFGALAVI
ncbi:MAG: hypothetical protein FJX60_15630 [Alphaproteobacteria bacterium]|nr:hypothetical protein [Alphaproteobacteria bacterium]